MFCSLNSEEGKKAHVALISYVSSLITNLASTSEAKFDIDQLMQEVYQQVYASTNNREQAIDIARMIPRIVLTLAPRDISRMTNLMSKGMDLQTLGVYTAETTNEESGVQFVESKLGLVEDVESNLKNLQEQHNSTQSVIDERSKEANKNKKVDPEGETSDITSLGIDPETGNTTIVEVDEIFDADDQIKELEKKKKEELDTREAKHLSDIKAGMSSSGLEKQYKKDIEEINTRYNNQIKELKEKLEIKIARKRFEALAGTALKDTAQEAISDDPNDPNYNVIDTDPKRRIHFNVKRKIIRLLHGGQLGSEINYPGVGKIYLRAQSKGTIPDERLLTDENPASARNTTDVVALVVDETGNPVLFDDAGNVNPNGNVVFFNVAKPYDIKAEYEVKRIAAIMEMRNISEDEAIEQLLDEKNQVNGIIDHVMQSPSTNTVMLDITGGMLGVIPGQEERYTLSKVNLNNASFTINKGENNIYTITIPSVSEFPITIFNPSLKSSPKLITLFTDLLINDVFFASGAEMNMSMKKRYLENFLYFSSDLKGNINIVDNKLLLFGKEYPLDTDLNKNQARLKLIEAFNTPFATTSLTYEEAMSKVAKGAKLVTTPNYLTTTQGDILEQTDPNDSSKKTYRVLSFAGLYISQKVWDLKSNESGTAPFFELNKNEDGKYIVNEVPNGYMNYVFENFLIDKRLNGNNELVSLNPYLTFKPINYNTIKTTPKQTKSDALSNVLKESNEDAAKDYNNLSFPQKEAFKITEFVQSTKTVRQSTAKIAADVLANNLKKGDYNSLTKEQAQELLDELIKSANLKKTHIAPLQKLIDSIFKPIDPFFNQDPTTIDTSETIELDDALKINYSEPSTLTDVEVTELSGIISAIESIDGEIKPTDEQEDEEDGYYKRQTQIDQSEKITKSQLEEAEEWFNSHPLSSVFTFREAYNLVNERNKDSVAQWTRNGIILFKGSNLTDLYHEAFHGFTQAFMTPAQRADLYNAVREKSGSFVTYKGETKNFADATDKEAEEFLAEDFRKWMLAGGKKTSLDKSNSKLYNFFLDLYNKLKALFGKSAINDIVANDKANAYIEEIYDKLRVGDLSGYKFSVDNLNQGFDVLYKGPQAVDENLPINRHMPYLNNTQAELLMKSVDAWMADILTIEGTGLSEVEALKFFNSSIDMYVNGNELTAEQIEKKRLKLASDLNYGKLARKLKSKQGRINLYKNVYILLGRTYNQVYERREKLIGKAKRSEAEQIELEQLQEKAKILYWAYTNFGDINNLDNNIQSEDGTYKGVIAYHMAASDAFGGAAIEGLDAIDQEESGSKSPYDHKSGNETSLVDLAKERAEVKYIFRTIFRINPETGLPYRNALGAPEIMDFRSVWNKVALLLENTLDPAEMYAKLIKFAASEDKTEMTYAVAQLINKLGPKGLNRTKFPHLQNIEAENLWTSFWSIFSNRRIALMAMTATISQDAVSKAITLESRIGRGINPNAKVGKKWDSDFAKTTTNKYKITEDGITRLDLKQIVKDFNSLKTKVQKSRKINSTEALEFLSALGINLTGNKEIIDALENGDPEFEIPGGFNILKTFFANRFGLNTLNPTISSLPFSEFPSYLEILANDPSVVIQRPSDLFIDRYNLTVKIAGDKYDLPKLDGEKKNWTTMQLLEGQFGSGIPSFMATTADGNTQFEHSLNSTMSVMVTDINNVEYYDDFLNLPHLRHLHYEFNPAAKNYAWLKEMFYLDKADGNSYGKRKIVNGIKVALQLNNISGVQVDDSPGVASAKADQFTKFILDVHLMTQVGLPELMRHSDKSTSYSVTLNIQSPLGDEFTNWTKGAMYMPNIAFLGNKEAYHSVLYKNYIIPNLNIELARIVRLRKKEKDIINQLKNIKKQKKEGLPTDPVPVFDLNYLKRGKEFLTFQGILNKDTKANLLDRFELYTNELIAEGKSLDKINLSDFLALNPELDLVINNETSVYFHNTLFNQTDLVYKESGGVLADNLISTFKSQTIKHNGNDNFYNGLPREYWVEGLLRSYTINTWIHNVESMNMLYGDPASYDHAKEDFHKRNAGMASTGTIYRVDDDMLYTINNTLGGREFENQYRIAAGIKQRDAYDGTMSTAVIADKKTVSIYADEIGYNLYSQSLAKALYANRSLPKEQQRSEKEIDQKIKSQFFGKKYKDLKITSPDSLKGVTPEPKTIMDNYFSMKEADAQGWITLDAYRALLFSQGEWTPGHQKLYADILNGVEIDQGQVGIFFAPIKAQYWGPLMTDSERIDAFHKFQLTPMIPTMFNSSPKLKALNEKMMREGIDYTLFQSGSKMGTMMKMELDSKGKLIGKADDIYDNSTREIKDNPFTINTIFVKYLKNQLKIAPKFKTKNSFPTQIRKIIETGLMENGVPSDYKPNDSIESRIATWDGLKYEDKLKVSDNFRKIIAYEKSVQRLTAVKRSQLFSKAKLNFNPKTGEVSGNLENVVEFLKKELSREDLADHELDFIQYDPHTKGLKADLSYSLSSELIESVLNALVTKALVRQKVNGEPLIQVSGAMLETPPQFTKPTDEQLKKYGTNGLSFFRLKQGAQNIEAMKIKIAMQGDFENLLYLDDVAVYKDLIKDKKVVVKNGKPVRVLDYNASLAKLNELIKNDEWLDKDDNRKLVSTFGVRIPTQSENAVVFAEVYEFLPKEAGNIIIVPSEIVAQSGGDFDIDKLTLQFPNISRQIVNSGAETPQYKIGLYKEFDQTELRAKYEKYKKVQAEFALLGNEFKSRQDKIRALELMQSMSKGNLIESTIMDMIKEGEILTFEEFALSDMEKAAQNDVMYSMIDIIKKPEAYINLVRPNSTDILDDLAAEAKKEFRGYRPDISTNDEDVDKTIQVSRIFEPIYNLFKHYTNNSSKAGVGIGAIDITYNEIFNRIGMYMTPNNREFVSGLEFTSKQIQDAIKLGRRARKVKSINAIKKARREKFAAENKIAANQVDKKLLKTEEERSFYLLTDVESKEASEVKKLVEEFKAEYKIDPLKLLQDFQRQTLYLPHNTMKVKDSLGNAYSDSAISLSHTTDVFGQNQISDTLSQLENGWLDAAKDPWIYYLRGNEALAPHILFLVQAGVPIDYVVQFISQPIIVDYMETIAKLQSQFGRLMDLGAGTGISRNKAKLAAKKLILNKLGYSLEGYEGKNDAEKLNKLISEEGLLTLPENGEFNLEQLRGQNKYVFDKYQIFDKNGKVNPQNLNINYSEEKLNDLQKQVFIHFLQISDMQDSIRDVKMKTNFDTTPSKTLVSVQNKITQLKELKRTLTEEDGDISSQNKYWRVPSKIIEKIVPTIKKTLPDGTVIDTGNLDESAIQSPIGSFYVQPIQNYLWSPLFPLKSNPIVNSFVNSLSFVQKDDARNNTWLNDDEELITHFKNALIPILFQNSFLSFDVRKLMAIDLEPVEFRDASVKIESVTALPQSGVIAKNEKGSITIYFDYNTLYNQFVNKEYAKEGYGGELALEVLPENQFTTFGEYVKFVFEREYVRAQYVDFGGRKNIESLFETNSELEYLYKDSISRVKSREDLSAYDKNKLRKRIAFEQFITNTALKNSYNMRALFHGNNTAYAFEITKLQDDPAYAKLIKEFSIFENLTADSETTKDGQNRINLAFVESVNDTTLINSYYEQVQHLSNSKYLSDLNRTRNLGLTREQIIEVESIFLKLPVIAFLQSGMEPHGRFALNRIVDENVIRAMTTDIVEDFKSTIEKESLRKDNKYTTLLEIFDAFVNANKKYDVRGKNYIIDRTKDGKPVLSLEDLRILNSDINPKEALFDPEYIQSNGLPSNGYIKQGDNVGVDVSFYNSKKPYSYEGVVDQIEYQNGLITIDIKQSTGARVKILFDTNGNVRTAYTSKADSPDTFSKVKSATPKFTISKYFVKEVVGDTRQYTAIGDTVEGTYVFRSGAEQIFESVSATINDIQDIGYAYTPKLDKLGKNRYLVNVTLNRKTPIAKQLVIDSEGKILGEIFKGQYKPSELGGALSTIVLRENKKSATDKELIFSTQAQLDKALQENRIPAGETVEILSLSNKSLPVSQLFTLDGNTGNLVPLTDDIYEDYLNKEEDIEELLEKKKRFVVYNGALTTFDDIAQDSSASTSASKKGDKLKLRDRYIHYGDFNLKVGIPTRKKYSGGKTQEYFEDKYDVISMVQKPDPEAVEQIDRMIDTIKIMIDNGYTPIFNNAGYGQYLIGANDDTGRMIPDAEATGLETFKYLSTRLLEVGFVNPNFVKQAEGVPAIIAATEQPATDEDIVELMKNCFLI